jgi:FAD synthase
MTGITKCGSSTLATASGLPVVTVVLPRDRALPAAGVYGCLVHTEPSNCRAAVTYLGASEDGSDSSPIAEVHVAGTTEMRGGIKLVLDFISQLRGMGSTPRWDGSLRALLEDARRAQALTDTLA